MWYIKRNSYYNNIHIVHDIFTLTYACKYPMIMMMMNDNST